MPAPPPEVELTPDLVRRLVGPLLGAPPREVRAVGEGWDHAAFLVDGAWAFRFPRRAAAVPLLEREMRLLPHLAPFLPAPIPVPEHVGAPSDAYPWPFAGHRALPGREAAQVRLDDEQRMELAVPVAQFLRALHALPVDVFEVELPRDFARRADMRRRVPQALIALGDLTSYGLIDDVGPWRAVIEPAEHLPTPPPSALVHGDLHARHLLVDDRGQLEGVIDWADVNHGDPGVDLSLLWSFFPPAARREFLDAYGPVPADRLLRARALAVYLCATLTTHALHRHEQALYDEALAGLHRCLDDGGVA